MSYGFQVIDSEDQMKNYFKGVSGRHIKDTLFITIINTGSKGWNKYKGYFKCDANQSNFFSGKLILLKTFIQMGD